MIIKRVTAALRRQDWTSVAIEFALVVLGVLLAFQINEWATEREASAERDAAAERLLREAEHNVAYMRLGVAVQQQLTRDLDFVLDRVRRGNWHRADEERMTIGLSRVTFAASPAPPSSVYDDIVASGAFGKFGDAQLRSAIANYRATLGFNGQYVTYLRERMPDLEEHEALRYAFAKEGTRRIRLEVDYPSLHRDQLLQEKLAILADGQLQLLLIRQSTLKGAERMCLELGRFVGRPCNLKLPPPTFD